MTHFLSCLRTLQELPQRGANSRNVLRLGGFTRYSRQDVARRDRVPSFTMRMAPTGMKYRAKPASFTHSSRFPFSSLIEMRGRTSASRYSTTTLNSICRLPDQAFPASSGLRQYRQTSRHRATSVKIGVVKGSHSAQKGMPPPPAGRFRLLASRP